MLKQNEKDVNSKNPGLGIRHIQIILYFTGLTICVAIRTTLSLAIVSMTDKSSDSNYETFNWNETIQGFVLSSFFLGCFVTQIPGGLLAHLFGGKIMFLISVTMASLLTIVIPIFAPFGWQYVCALRFINGLFQGCFFPSLFTLMPKWIHPSERVFSVIILTASQFGIFSMLIVSGEIIASPNLGWPGVFYVSGVAGLLWSILWFWFGANTPAEYNGISTIERKYLEDAFINHDTGKVPIPWKYIFTSVPFLSLVIVHSTQNWGFITMLTETPSYVKHVLDFDIKESAILSALPFIATVICSILFGALSDFLINNKYISRTMARKTFNSIGHWIPMLCFIGLGYVTKDNFIIGIVLLILSQGFNAGINVGFNLNHMDLAPNLAGSLYGITNFVANIMSMLGPIFAGLIITDAKDPYLWRIVFFVIAFLFFIGNLIFLIFGKSSVQFWNNLHQNETPINQDEQHRKVMYSQLSVC